jgi:hypothetical protein
MAQNKLIEVYKGLPDWARGLTIVGGIGILFYIGYTAVRRVRKVAELGKDLEESDTAQKDLEELKRKGVIPSISNTQVQNVINSLVEAMNGCGTDEGLVYAQFEKLNNLADVQLLISKWGVQYYRPCAVEQPISYSLYLANPKKFGGNLSTWLNYDLSKSEIKKINDILAKKNINFKF